MVSARTTEAPERQYRFAVDQINVVLIRKWQHVGQQLAEHRTVYRRFVGTVGVELFSTELIEKRLQLFQLDNGLSTFLRGGAGPGNHIAG